MRAVIDTNVLLSVLLWHGPPHALLEQARNGMVTLISSPALLAELPGLLRHHAGFWVTWLGHWMARL